MKTKLVLVIYILSYSLAGYSQADSIIYTKDYEIKNGIYVSIEDFKRNKPNLTADDFKKYNPDIDYLDGNFFENKGAIGVARRKISYPDSLGILQTKTIDSLFGFVKDNFQFAIRHSDYGIGFRVLRIFTLGIISYCFDVSPNSEEKVMPFIRDKKNDYNPLLSSSKNATNFGFQPKVPQFILYFKTGMIYDYNPLNFENLIQQIDQDIYESYTSFSDKQKKILLYSYILKTNNQNPIYFKE